MIHFFDIPQKAFEWIDISEPSNETLENFGREHNLHPNTLRDCLQPDHLPKFETFSDGVNFIVVRRLSMPWKNENLRVQDMTTKVAVFFDGHRLVTIHRKSEKFLQEIYGDCIKQNSIDAPSKVVTHIVYKALLSYEQFVEDLILETYHFEDQVFLARPPSDLESQLYFLKRRASVLRHVLELTGGVMVHLRNLPKVDVSSVNDAQDLYTQLSGAYAEVRDNVVSLLNIHLALATQRTNEVVKILTIFSAFFLPLTFIVGIYGMNFHYMPELVHPLGYFAVLLSMALISLVIYAWFKRKGWL